MDVSIFYLLVFLIFSRQQPKILPSGTKNQLFSRQAATFCDSYWKFPAEFDTIGFVPNNVGA